MHDPLRALLAIAVSLLATVAHAQSAPSLDGTWTGTATSPSTGNTLQIDMEIKDTAGTWKYTAPAANAKRAGACFGREFPLQVRPLSAAQYAVSVDGARLISGCPVFTLTLERVSDATLEGRFLDGRAAKLVRQ
ncbi:MAG: hypothetical protein RLZZ373_1487 [Pseudomonadota bacterium]|jgi:hypothetical protein